MDNRVDAEDAAPKPEDVLVVDYVEGHLREMWAMDQALQQTSSNCLAMQCVPRHMRRRAASHDIRRLPRRMRAKAQWEHDKAGAAPKNSKRPSRRHRRRPRNLLSEYQRRSKGNVWLETHIWHAKRFHMAELWGYKIPLHPNDKGVRAAYRANQQHCLMHDLSYLCCLELQGPQDELIMGLRLLTSPETGLGFGAKSMLSGNREGSTFIYAKQRYPHKAICEVSFLWRPHDEAKGSARSLWLWVHPAAYDEAINEIVTTFELDKVEEMEAVEASESDEVVYRINPITNKAEIVPDVLPKILFRNGSVEFRSLKDTLCRFRLTGPLAQSILAEALKPSQLPATKSDEDSKWWQMYYMKKSCRKVLKEQHNVWACACEAASPAELPPHMVLGLTVRDPRLFIPQKKNLQPLNESDVETLCDFPEAVSSSPIWEKDVRESVKQTKITEQEFNSLRSKQFVPGRVLDLGNEESCVPVLLIQRPGRQSAALSHAGHPDHRTPGFAAGWDLILPSGWGMAFWISLVYRGARAAGLKELQSTAFELGHSYFPFSHPDTISSQKMEQLKYAELRGKYDRIPPAKRPNHAKLGVVAPFHFPWHQLTSEWLQRNGIATDDLFFVLRSKSQLASLNAVCLRKKQDLEQTVLQHKRCLVPVVVYVLLRGHPGEHAMVCIPTKEDLQALSADRQYAGPLEELHANSATYSKPDNYDLANVSVNHVIDTSSRDVIGYVTCGDYVLSQGQGGAVGYVALQGFLQLITQERSTQFPLVLVRDCNSCQYRFAQLSVKVLL